MISQLYVVEEAGVPGENSGSEFELGQWYKDTDYNIWNAPNSIRCNTLILNFRFKFKVP